MKKYLGALVLLTVSTLAFGQQTATVEDGRKVLLHPDGKWEFVQPPATGDGDDLKEAGKALADRIIRGARAEADSLAAADGESTTDEGASVRRPTSSLSIGGRRLLAGGKTVINNENGGLATYVTVAKDGEKTLIMFWQESGDSHMSFFNWNWVGTVYLYLGNGEIISLTDRNMHGQNKIPNGKIDKYDMKSDLYQRFSGHYLTMSECQKLKRSNLARISYRTTEEEQSNIRLDVTENPDAISEQLLAIGR